MLRELDYELKNLPLTSRWKVGGVKGLCEEEAGRIL